MAILDPLGFWKSYRDNALESWSKVMIDSVNSEDYARFTGMFLDQYLSMTQPVQDAVQKSMTYSLAWLNMPTRDEVLSIAERLVHIETRLDDLDAETFDMHTEDQKAFRATERRIDKVESRMAAGDESVAKELRAVDRSLDKVLNTIMARLNDLDAKVAKERSGVAPKPQLRAETEREAKSKAEK
jgi:polyhydroxyalkanoic acid synthase PhaR subunit